MLYPAGSLNSNVTSTPHPVHVGLTYRGETTPGGFFTGGDDADVLIEGAVVTAGQGECFHVSPRSQLLAILNASCTLQQ